MSGTPKGQVPHNPSKEEELLDALICLRNAFVNAGMTLEDLRFEIDQVSRQEASVLVKTALDKLMAKKS